MKKTDPFPKTIKIEVTQRDIDRGVVEDCFLCPVALATRRAVGRGISTVAVKSGGRVEIDRVRQRKGGDTWEDAYYNSPKKVTHFIDTFDRKQPVNPFTATLKLDRVSR
jgi:hypothetical protein